jgi:proteasome accessory factor B
MPRNAEVIRQWSILVRLDRAQHVGVSVDDLAKEHGKSKRTIWRDMEALQQVGFPLTSEIRDGRTCWILTRMPLKAVHDSGLSVTEVCSLSMSRALLAAMPGAPFAEGLAALFKKIDRALSPKMREFLAQLPGVITVKPGARKKQSANYAETVARLIDACARRRVATMRYYSASSGREKHYEVHPYQVAYADGGLYLTAFVPDYRQVRTFAVERMRTFVLQDRGFAVSQDLSATEPFGQSLGVNRGKPERVEIEFAARVAPHIREREWHTSQQLRDLPDGGVRVTLKVCRDWALRAWILGFGPHARVIAPQSLAEEILEMIEDARDGYLPRLALDAPSMPPIGQPLLPQM